jgi:hypothetical protein
MKYNFYLEQKITAWERYHFSVEADSLEAAKAEAIIEANENDLDNIDSIEILDYTNTEMSVEDNGGYATMEIFHPEDRSIPFYRNGKS